MNWKWRRRIGVVKSSTSIARLDSSPGNVSQLKLDNTRHYNRTLATTHGRHSMRALARNIWHMFVTTGVDFRRFFFYPALKPFLTTNEAMKIVTFCFSRVLTFALCTLTLLRFWHHEIRFLQPKDSSVAGQRQLKNN